MLGEMLGMGVDKLIEQESEKNHGNLTRKHGELT
jgi:hypothetical protein